MPSAEAPQAAPKKLSEIARLIEGEVVGDGEILIRGACGLEEAAQGDITFLAHPKHLDLLRRSRASAVITGRDVDFRDKPAVRTANPALAFLKVLEIWFPPEKHSGRGVDGTAVVSPRARLGKRLTIGPGAVIEDDVEIGDDTAVLAQSFVGRGSRLGRNVLLYPRVTVRERSRIDDRVILHPGVVIGSDGFGYEPSEGRHVKVPQTGTVWIQEDVEIGANSCVDRGRFGSTVVKRGTKIDNLVQIAHNVTIGEHCLIVSQVGIAGSAVIGDRVTLAGQVGVAGHLQVGAGAVIGAQSGVFTDVPAGSILLGSPPLPIREHKEQLVYLSRLPELFREFKELKKKIEGKLS
jgi:UDP-3-O-[3-hydroxymyristoyl] glucosamine N-acyltransferase